MKARFSLLVAIVLGAASSSWAEPNLVYPWDARGPAPSMDCLDVPCVPCVLSLPGLTAARCKVPADAVVQMPVAEVVEAPTVAAVDATLPGLRPSPHKP